MSFSAFFLCIYLVCIVVAAPYSPPLLARQDTNTTDDILQVINATILDHNNVDITSSFEIMVLYDPDTTDNLTTNSSAPGSGLSGRQAPLSRQITYCPIPNLEFVESRCTPADNVPSSLQAYIITCHRIQNIYDPYTGLYKDTIRAPVVRSGHCWADENCVNGLGPGHELENSIGLQHATCVNRNMYHRLRSQKPIGLNLAVDSIKGAMDGKKLSMLVSKTDGITPLEVDTLDVEAKQNVLGAVGEDGTVQSQKCRDCVELETEQFVKGTESLKAQARLLTTGAVAGVLWLTLSG